MQNFKHSDVPESDLEIAGFRFGNKGVHSARTMMFLDLSDLLAALPADATREDYAEAIIEDNVLGKQTAATRRLSNQRLGELYGLSQSIPMFRVMRRLWDIDEQGRPLIALLCALARDTLLRASTQVVLPMQVGAELSRNSMTSSILAVAGNRLNAATLDKVVRNASSSWAQSGHLQGRVRKIRQQVRPTPAAVAFALWMGSINGYAGEDLLRTSWARVLDQSPAELLDLTLRAKQMSLINASAGGGVVEIDVSPLNSIRGLF